MLRRRGYLLPAYHQQHRGRRHALAARFTPAAEPSSTATPTWSPDRTKIVFAHGPAG